MIVTLEARLPCLLCGHQARLLAFPSVRVSKRSLRQLPGNYMSWGPGVCEECGTDNHGVWARASCRLTPKSEADVAAYRAVRWRELAAEPGQAAS